MLNISQGHLAMWVLRCPDALKYLPTARDFAASAYTVCVLCVINGVEYIRKIKKFTMITFFPEKNNNT